MDQHVSTVEQGLDRFSERPSSAKETSAGRCRLARLVGVTLGALTVACSAEAAAIASAGTFQLAAAPEDFKALGSGKEVEVREDGRRTPQSSDYFEWWYFDGLFHDGTVFVVWFGDNWLYGSHKRALNSDVTPPGKPTRHSVRTFDDPGAFSSDHADVQIGPHRFKGDLETYAIHVDAAETGGCGLQADSAPQGRLLPPGNRLHGGGRQVLRVARGRAGGSYYGDADHRRRDPPNYGQRLSRSQLGQCFTGQSIRPLVVGARHNRRLHDHRRRYPWQGRGGRDPYSTLLRR